MSHKQFAEINRGFGGVFGIQLPLLEDRNGTISRLYGVDKAGAGHSFRAYFIVDPDQVMMMKMLMLQKIMMMLLMTVLMMMRLMTVLMTWLMTVMMMVLMSVLMMVLMTVLMMRLMAVLMMWLMTVLRMRTFHS